MAIVKMNKIALAAPQSLKDDVLNLIQTEEAIHIVDLSEVDMNYEGVEYFTEGKVVTDTQMDYNHIKISYEFLKNYSKKKSGLFDKKEVILKNEFDELNDKINWRSIYQGCREIEEGINLNKSEKSKLGSQLEQYSQWANLDVTTDELDTLKKASYFIGYMNSKYESNLYEDLDNAFNDIYIQKISEKQQDINLFMLCHIDDSQDVSEILKKYGFTRATLDLNVLPSVKVSELKELSVKLDKQVETLNEKALNLSEKIGDIEKIYDFYTVRLEKENSISKLIKTNETFILQGWIFKDRADEIVAKLEGKFKDIYISIEEPGVDDAFPIALKNNAFAEPFEAVTELYSLPLPTEIDPTPVIAPFFMFFFGMMMADIGYGLVMAIGGLFALKFIELGSGTKKFIKLLLYCSITTIIFGFLYGSFFGGIINLKPIWTNPVDKPMDVLIWSMVFGLVHLFTGLGVKGYMLIKAGKVIDVLYDVITWYGLIIGLIMLLTIGGAFPKILSIVSAVGIVATQGRSNTSIVGKFFGGLYGLYGITGYLGDVLSYSRLLALGLATGLIGWAFNLLIGLVSGPAVFIAGPLIFIVGHTFNFLIGLLGTFVHTSRLQYLEFFGKFYEGGGKAYAPLKINTKFINVKRVN
ncbi:MAG: V-type ATP synthase subunit I [Lutisporaceae bacterium]